MLKDRIQQASSFLEKRCGVVADAYAPYRGGYLFRAYPKGHEKQDTIGGVWYFVDRWLKSAGPISPAFDLKGISKAWDHLIDL